MSTVEAEASVVVAYPLDARGGGCAWCTALATSTRWDGGPWRLWRRMRGCVSHVDADRRACNSGVVVMGP
ncbi:hypothetical protein GALMADRAFT_249563, partial [Galerina marginata CBS 339.88]